MTPLCFVDCETTSLARPCSPSPGEIWEVGLILRDQHGEEEHRWLLPVTLEHADPESLKIGGFHQRHPQGDHWTGPDPDDLVADMAKWAEAFATLTHGAHLVGNVISFDEERLAALLVANGVQPAWHYHLIDVEALAAGHIAAVARRQLATAQSASELACACELAAVARPRWASDELSAALDVTPPTTKDRHTALGDARWARDLYDAVMGP